MGEELQCRVQGKAVQVEEVLALGGIDKNQCIHMSCP